jgi:hypothetical protein
MTDEDLHTIAHEANLAKRAYEAYCDVVNWKNYQGLPVPRWHELPAKIREAWMAAAKAVA